MLVRLTPKGNESTVIVSDNTVIASHQFGLTRRESEIILRVCRGLSDKEIAHDLRISPNTVRAFMRKILQKLGVRGRMEAALKVMNNGVK